MNTYTVKIGDSLSAITKKFTGSYTQWKTLYNLNSAKIKDPNKIFPGQVLTLPDSWSPLGNNPVNIAPIFAPSQRNDSPVYIPEIAPGNLTEAQTPAKSSGILPIVIGAGLLYWLT